MNHFFSPNTTKTNAFLENFSIPSASLLWTVLIRFIFYFRFVGFIWSCLSNKRYFWNFKCCCVCSYFLSSYFEILSISGCYCCLWDFNFPNFMRFYWSRSIIDLVSGYPPSISFLLESLLEYSIASVHVNTSQMFTTITILYFSIFHLKLNKKYWKRFSHTAASSKVFLDWSNLNNFLYL